MQVKIISKYSILRNILTDIPGQFLRWRTDDVKATVVLNGVANHGVYIYVRIILLRMPVKIGVHV
jgi:hypothetical protein